MEIEIEMKIQMKVHLDHDDDMTSLAYNDDNDFN